MAENHLDSIELYYSSSNIISESNVLWSILLDHSFDNNISGNTLSGDESGWGSGILFYTCCSNNTISRNVITHQLGGIRTWDSSFNIISENDITGNAGAGEELHAVSLWGSSSNIISRNNITNNSFGIDIEGPRQHHLRKQHNKQLQ